MDASTLKYDKQNSNQIEKFYLHDASIASISCDYKGRKVLIDLNFFDAKLNEVMIELEFVNVFHVEIPIFAPWGEGYYIKEVSASDEFVVRDSTYPDLAEGFVTKLLLNSGDEITVQAGVLIQTQKAK